MAFTKDERDRIIDRYRQFMDLYLTTEHAGIQQRLEAHVRRLAAASPEAVATPESAIWSAIERDDPALYAEYQALSVKAFNAACEMVVAEAAERLRQTARDASAEAG
jgi:hypothetical protein